MSNHTTTNPLEQIVNTLENGEFIYIWINGQGLPYCPTQLIGMTSYLWSARFNFVSTTARLNTLNNLLNIRFACMDPGRVAMIRHAMASVFPQSGVFAFHPNIQAFYHNQNTPHPHYNFH